jgi:hypothetical protein
MTDIQTLLVPWCSVPAAIRVGRRTAGGALVLALLAPALAAAQAPTPRSGPGGITIDRTLAVTHRGRRGQ